MGWGLGALMKVEVSRGGQGEQVETGRRPVIVVLYGMQIEDPM